MGKRLLLLTCLLGLLAVVPTLGAVPSDPKPVTEGVKGAKQLTPVLDMAGKELKRVGIRLVDSAFYSMEQLWQDTLNLKLKPHAQ